MIYRVLNEFNITSISNNIKLNVTDIRSGHDVRVKVIPSTDKPGKSKSTSVPLKEAILSFDELFNDDHTYRMKKKNGTGIYLEFTIGFVIMNHGKLIEYKYAVISGNTYSIEKCRNELALRLHQYESKYSYKDISSIRRDSNEHVRLIRAGVIEDT